MRTLFCALAAIALAACGGPAVPTPEEPLLAPDLGMLTFGGTFGTAVFVDSSPQQTLQLRDGGKKDLIVDNVSIEGPDAAMFTAVPSGQTATSGKAVYVVVTYTPTSAGRHNAFLVIHSNTSSYELKRENTENPFDPMQKLPPLQVGPTTKMEIAAVAVWRYTTKGTVTDTATPAKALSGMKVTCVKPKGTSCSSESDCVAQGLTCVEQTCQPKNWTGWEKTTGADGKFSADHSWDCGEILVQDPAATPTYASNVGPFTPKTEISVKLDAAYKVTGKVVEKGTSTGLANIKISCMAPPSAPLSWKGWTTTTGGDGTFSNTGVWPCRELVAEDSTNAYAPATGTWSTAAAGVTIEMEKH
ncbi:MAG: hypothetical protein QM765_44240 [Myxococcales bacterium]